MSSHTTNSIELRGVNYAYPKSPIAALHSIDLELSPGDFCVMTGESGSGKTTLIRMLAGELPPRDGYLHILGKESKHSRALNSTRLRRKISVVYQDFKLINTKTVYANIAYSLEVSNYKPAVVRARTGMVLEMLNLTKYADKYPAEISGGERQRVSIARAVSMKPKVLLADEPTGNLDSDNSSLVFSMLQSLSNDGTIVVIASHDISVNTYIDLSNSKRIRMHNGSLRESELSHV